MNDLLRGAYDLHIRTAPDVVPRKCTDLEAARRMLAAGMGGGAIKCHYLDTAARAALLREQFPQLNIVGGVVLNRSVGGLNPCGVERTAQAGGKLLWFPTLESREYQCFQHRSDPTADLSSYIPVCDENGRLLPAALDILDAAAQQIEAVRLGAVVEHSFFTTYYGRTPVEEIARQIRVVGCENVILTTDFGQPKSPFFDEGMARYAHLLLENGFTPDELRQIMCQNPRRILS
jgi:hypothetical protein